MSALQTTAGYGYGRSIKKNIRNNKAAVTELNFFCVGET